MSSSEEEPSEARPNEGFALLGVRRNNLRLIHLLDVRPKESPGEFDAPRVLDGVPVVPKISGFEFLGLFDSSYCYGSEKKLQLWFDCPESVQIDPACWKFKFTRFYQNLLELCEADIYRRFASKDSIFEPNQSERKLFYLKTYLQQRNTAMLRFLEALKEHDEDARVNQDNLRKI